jgi:putrescine transport system ATP-binding protein
MARPVETTRRVGANSDLRPPLIRFENVTRRFGPVTAVNSLSLDIHEGEVFSLLGPSGCGKTTLMRMLAGFEAPDSGRILLDGQDLAGMPPHLRPVNMMFQSYALFPHLTVAANIGFGLKQAGLNRAAIAAKVERLVALVQLQGLEDRKPAALSGGQKQRVALARALAREPKVLLLDEPLAALDRKIREQTQFELMRIQRELGATFMVVTHDQDEAMVLSDRIGVMQAGRIEQVGAPREIYERPASRAVAAFVGDINLIEAATGAQDGGLTLFAAPPFPAGLAAAMAASDEAPANGQNVAIAVRPENVILTPGHAPPVRNMAHGHVADLAYLGDWTMIIVALTGGGTVKASRGNAGRAGRGDVAIGDAVTVSFAPDDTRVLSR